MDPGGDGIRHFKQRIDEFNIVLKFKCRVLCVYTWVLFYFGVLYLLVDSLFWMFTNFQQSSYLDRRFGLPFDPYKNNDLIFLCS
jgi:hypothetical protein